MSTEAFDRGLLDWWAGLAELDALPGDPGDLAAVGDQEISYHLAEAGDRYAVDRTDRGFRDRTGTFGDATSALRYLLALVGEQVRDRLGFAMLPLDAPMPAAGEVDAYRVADAEFPGGLVGRRAAQRYAKVAGATPGQITASFRHPTGRPLFG